LLFPLSLFKVVILTLSEGEWERILHLSLLVSSWPVLPPLPWPVIRIEADNRKFLSSPAPPAN
jgi:hypothetical protein